MSNSTCIASSRVFRRTGNCINCPARLGASLRYRQHIERRTPEIDGERGLVLVVGFYSGPSYLSVGVRDGHVREPEAPAVVCHVSSSLDDCNLG